MSLKIAFIVGSLFLLLYLVWPGPTSISDFPLLSNSTKSNLPGDTTQVSDIAAFFSNNFRNFVTHFYKEEYQKLSRFPFPPIRLNHPPEFAYVAIKDQTQSTYLEEYVYPLRDSLFVNGMEPFTKEGVSRFKGAAEFGFAGKQFKTKTTLRFYLSTILSRIVVWLGVNLVVLWLWRMSKKVADE